VGVETMRMLGLVLYGLLMWVWGFVVAMMIGWAIGFGWLPG
jgi:hypothetical protein